MTEHERKKWWAPVGLALLCAHCSLGVLLAIAGVAGVAGWWSGASVRAWVLPPTFLLGAFAWLVWPGRACPA